MRDLLLKRYGGAYRETLELDLDEFEEQLIYAIEESQEERLWIRWVINYEKEMSLREMKGKLGINNLTNPTSMKSHDEIMEDVDEIIRMMG